MTENVWVTPATTNLQSVMDGIVLNAGEVQNVQTNLSRSQVILNTAAIAQVRAAILAGGKTPLSTAPGTVPPEAEFHCYVLTVNVMTAAKPNLGAVVIAPNGSAISPWLKLVDEAKKYISDLRMGKTIPTAPASPVMVGGGPMLIPWGLFYPVSGNYTNNLVLQGLQYYWTPGPNDVSLTCGATTLTAAGSFVASSPSVTLTGTSGGIIITSQLQLATPAANYARGGNIRGEVDLTTSGPYGWYGVRPGQQGYSLTTDCPERDDGVW